MFKLKWYMFCWTPWPEFVMFVFLAVYAFGVYQLPPMEGAFTSLVWISAGYVGFVSIAYFTMAKRLKTMNTMMNTYDRFERNLREYGVEVTISALDPNNTHGSNIRAEVSGGKIEMFGLGTLSTTTPKCVPEAMDSISALLRETLSSPKHQVAMLKQLLMLARGKTNVTDKYIRDLEERIEDITKLCDELSDDVNKTT